MLWSLFIEFVRLLSAGERDRQPKIQCFKGRSIAYPIARPISSITPTGTATEKNGGAIVLYAIGDPWFILL